MTESPSLELTVVRHGVTAWNLERRYQGTVMSLADARGDGRYRATAR